MGYSCSKARSSSLHFICDMPKRWASGPYISRVSSEMLRLWSGSSARIVSMLWSRSESFIRMTLTSPAIAMSILRMFSACRSSRLENLKRSSLVTPSMM